MRRSHAHLRRRAWQVSGKAAASLVGLSRRHSAPGAFQAPAIPGSRKPLSQVRASSARLAHVPTKQPTPGAPMGSHPPAPARPAPTRQAKSEERRTAARTDYCTIEAARIGHLPSVGVKVALFPPSDLFDEIGVAMARVGKMRVPAAGRAKDQLDLARVACGDRTTNHLGPCGNGLAAHGTNESRRGSHQPDHLPRQRRCGLAT